MTKTHIITNLGINGFINAKDAFAETIDIIERRRKGEAFAFSTRWKNLNKALGGGIPFYTTTTIAARTGVGKSAFSNLLVFDLFECNPTIPILLLYWNWEMPSYQQYLRKFSNLINLSVQELMSADKVLEDSSFMKILALKERFESLNIFFMDTSVDVKTFHSTIRKVYDHNKKTGHKIVNVIDHTRLLSAPYSTLSEEQKIKDLMHACNQITKEFKCTNIVISQLNRKIEDDFNNSKIGYRRPSTADIFGSDSVAQYSNIVMLLHRPEMYGLDKYQKERFGVQRRLGAQSDDCINKMYLEIVKNRDGESPLTITFNINLKNNSIEEWKSMI